MIRLILTLLALLGLQPRRPRPLDYPERLALGNAFNRTQPTTKGD